MSSACKVILQEHFINVSCDLWVRALLDKSLPCQVLFLQTLWQWRYIGFNLSQDLAKPYDQNDWEPLKVSHYPPKFCGHRYFDSRDMFLVCWLILQDPVVIVGHRPAKFGGDRHCCGGVMFSVIEEKDSMFPFKSTLLFLLNKAHGMTCSNTKFQINGTFFHINIFQ